MDDEHSDPGAAAGEPDPPVADPPTDSTGPTAADPTAPALGAVTPEPVGDGFDPSGAVALGAPLAVPRMVVPRWIQAVVLPLALVGLYELARASGPVVPIITVASIVALILNPLAKRLQRWMPRSLAIAGSYLVVLIGFAAIGVVIIDPIATEINHFAHNVPQFTRKANRELDSIQTWLSHHGIKVHIQKQGQTALQAIQKQVLKRSDSIVSFSKSVLSTLLTISVDGVIVFVLSVYMLAYASQIGELFRRIMPPSNGTPQDDYPLLIQKAVTRYVGGQLSLSLIMGASAAVMMWLFGTIGLFHDGSRFALFFGGFYGLTELIPYVGPIIGPVPALAVALFSHPISALWVLIAFVALQQLEGHVVAPQLFRISLRINPILVILALLVGEEVWGIVGALVALPVATIFRQTALYLRDHLVMEPWTRLPPVPPS